MLRGAGIFQQPWLVGVTGWEIDVYLNLMKETCLVTWLSKQLQLNSYFLWLWWIVPTLFLQFIFKWFINKFKENLGSYWSQLPLSYHSDDHEYLLMNSKKQSTCVFLALFVLHIILHETDNFLCNCLGCVFIQLSGTQVSIFPNMQRHFTLNEINVNSKTWWSPPEKNSLPISVYEMWPYWE